MTVPGLAMRYAGAALIVLAALMTPIAGGAQSSSGQPPAPPASSEDLQALRERVATFWAARLAGDPKAQWELLEPRGRGRLTMQEYASGRGAVRYIAYQVEDATVKGYFAVVKVRLMVQPILPSGRRVPVQTTVAEDYWVRIGGVWYRNLEEGRPGHAPGGIS
jgi:hypothetical protein